MWQVLRAVHGIWSALNKCQPLSLRANKIYSLHSSQHHPLKTWVQSWTSPAQLPVVVSHYVWNKPPNPFQNLKWSFSPSPSTVSITPRTLMSFSLGYFVQVLTGFPPLPQSLLHPCLCWWVSLATQYNIAMASTWDHVLLQAKPWYYHLVSCMLSMLIVCPTSISMRRDILLADISTLECQHSSICEMNFVVLVRFSKYVQSRNAVFGNLSL